MDLKKLIQKIKKGDQAAFRQLVEEHQQYAFRLSFRILCNEEEAKDTVQESFIKIWKNINNYDHNTKFTTWMYKIVTNTAVDKLRKLKRHLNIRIESVSDAVISPGKDDMNRNLDNKETAQLISVLAEDLSEKQRLVFVMRDIEGMRSEEVQQILDLPETSIKSNLYHARKAIRDKLNQLTTIERRTI